MLDNQREKFSTLGFVLAAAGSAVGLGNFWRFPFMAGTNGGAAFVIVYLILILVVGIGLLLASFSIGKHGQVNAIDSYKKIVEKAKWIGYLGFGSAFIFLSYFSVVGGWTIFFAGKSVTGLTKIDPSQMGAFFGNFTGAPILPLVFHAIFMGLTVFIIAKGISDGIEKYTKILMPALFIMMIILAIRSLTLDGAMKGVNWYLTPDFSKITLSTLVAALGQVFFTLSVGMSGMVTYASYLDKDANLSKTTVQVVITNTIVALLAGFIIFPAVFAFGLDPASGPGLIFITIPNVFSQMPAGSIFAFIFFVLLAIASLTSSISILEMPVAILIEKFDWSRKKAAYFVGGVSFVLGIAVSFSFGIWSDFLIFGKSIFGIFDYIGSNIVLPLGALGIALTVGWGWNREDAVGEVTNKGKLKVPYANSWYSLTKYIIPVIIIIIFFASIGII